jgi:hyperosmotically inducible periplasmic protein
MNARKSFFPLLLTACLLTSALRLCAQNSDAQLQAAAQKALSGARFRNVQVAAHDASLVLTGTVANFADKMDAEKKVRHLHGAEGLQDKIEVAGPETSDEALQAKLAKAIEYDRVGYRTTPFNAISVEVQDRVVMLGGYAYGPVDADSAYQLAAHTPGVKEVINRIHVDPTSPMDDGIRLRVFRTVYGYPTLNKYAIDPGKPIRIQVENGHVTLYGAVDTQADKDAAGIRANTVPGVFSVTNDLRVANQPGERPGARQ